MANINQAQLDELQKTLNADWTAAWAAPPQVQLRALATIYTSTGRSNHYAFLEALGMWSAWNGARQFKDIKSNQVEVVNEDFECSIKMPENDLKDDNTGLYSAIVPSMVGGWFKKQQVLIKNVLVNNPVAYDGTALFSTTRQYGASVINNLSTSALSSTTFNAAYVAMQSYTDHQGEPLAVKPDLLVVGPALAKTASDILGNLYIGDGNTSPNAVQIQNYFNALGVGLLVSPYLIGDYANYWYLADTSDVVKGVLLQIRETPMPVMSNEQEVARNKTIDYMASGRMAAAPGAPHKIYGGLKSA